MVLLVAGDARAYTCPVHNPEQFDVSFVEVERDGEASNDPIGLEELSAVILDRESKNFVGFEVDETALSSVEKGYVLDELIAPSAAAQVEMDEAKSRRGKWTLMCGRTPYQPIRPGTYLFSGDLNKPPGQLPEFFDAGLLTIAADRDTVTLEFSYDDADWRAAYDVDRAFFPGADDGCGCTSATNRREGGFGLVVVCLLVLGLRQRSRASVVVLVNRPGFSGDRFP